MLPDGPVVDNLMTYTWQSIVKIYREFCVDVILAALWGELEGFESCQFDKPQRLQWRQGGRLDFFSL